MRYYDNGKREKVFTCRSINSILFCLGSIYNKLNIHQWGQGGFIQEIMTYSICTYIHIENIIFKVYKNVQTAEPQEIPHTWTKMYTYMYMYMKLLSCKGIISKHIHEAYLIPIDQIWRSIDSSNHNIKDKKWCSSDPTLSLFQMEWGQWKFMPSLVENRWNQNPM